MSAAAPGAAESAGTALVVLRALGLGDFVTSVPALRALERAFPDRRRILAGPAWYWDLTALAGLDWRVLPTELLRTPPWDGAHPLELAVNLHGRGPQSTEALAALAPRRLWAHADPGEPGRPGPPWPGRVHDTEIWCGLLRAHGLAADPDDLWWPPPDHAPADDTAAPLPERASPPHRNTATGPDSGAGTAVVHPGASAASRRWPPERFATVVRHLHDRGLRVLITGSRAERPLAERVARTAAPAPAQVPAGRTGVGELARLVADADLVVCGDTGVAHLATAYRTPSVRLFGPVSPALWGPRVDEGIHACLWKGGESDPHASALDPGLASITADDVLSACSDVLSRTGVRP
ncbi:ADP-heptose:LPS heptosyltransferase [Nocardiopsis sp. Huas11]|uniref:glycosyltransferase family 9 protein n=1 Tax=Nocardiopsis sp. Huas11 TaxID=2183912 RepID=UPI000F148828|nr:glycosyltransferase family 9 protein [Nocardiopsis sp. Huas11]RKS10672.1 ADP-heptose:LPS heptosyltransferase [Nocardiopsis sp. Huas11]